MYFEANSFMNAYVLKKEQLKAALGKISHEISQPCCIVLLSFACELYFKALFCIEKIEEDDSISVVKMKKGHELDDLFNRLSNDLKKMVSQKTNYKVEELTQQLNVHKNDFIEWRYIFEKDSQKFKYNVSFLENIANTLYEIAKDKFENINFNSSNISFELMG